MWHKRERLLSIFGALSFSVLLLCSGMALAADDAREPPTLESWIDHAADGFAGGTGTEDDPYLIATAEQLAYLAKTVNEGNNYIGLFFKLYQDIDLAKYDWVAIGSLSDNQFTENTQPYLRKHSVFSGNFDGNNKTIKNLTINTACIESGLFGYLRACEVKNLILIDINIQSCFLGGGLAAQAHDVRLKNCYVSGRIEGFWTLGGLIGYTFWADIYNCSINVKIYLSNQPMPQKIMSHQIIFYGPTSSRITNVNLRPVAGGIVGYVANLATPVTIDNCIVSWEVCGWNDQYSINAIAVDEGGGRFIIANCKIIKDFSCE